MTARIIGIVSGKGGVGKTTLAINLGSAPAHHFQKNVLLIDCNLTTSHVSLHLDMHHTPATLNKALRGEMNIMDCVHPHFSGLKIVPASISMRDIRGVDITKIHDVVKQMVHKEDIILLDAAPGFGREAMGAINASDELVYVTTPHLPSAMDIVRCQEIVDGMHEPVGIISNMVGKDKHEITNKEIEYMTNLPVVLTVPYDRKISESLHKKVPATVMHPKSKASMEIIDFAARLSGEKAKERNIIDRSIAIFG